MLFVVDASSSIDIKNWHYVREFIAKFVQEVDLDVGSALVGVISFTDSAVRRVQFADYPVDELGLLEEISHLNYEGGSTAVYTGLAEAVAMLQDPSSGARSDVDNLVVVIHDGYTQYEQLIPLHSQYLKMIPRTTVYAVSVTSVSHLMTLGWIASQPTSLFVKRVDATDELPLLGSEMGSALCRKKSLCTSWSSWSVSVERMRLCDQNTGYGCYSYPCSSERRNRTALHGGRTCCCCFVVA